MEKDSEMINVNNRRVNLRKGFWSTKEDEKLIKYMLTNGRGCWSEIARNAGLQRCGKSCRLRWMNYLRPCLKRGPISHEEEVLIIRLHSVLGNRWSQIASRLPGRTDNDIKNFWNTTIKKRLRMNTLPTSPNDNDSFAENREIMMGSIISMHEHDFVPMSVDSFLSPSTISMQHMASDHRLDPLPVIENLCDTVGSASFFYMPTFLAEVDLREGIRGGYGVLGPNNKVTSEKNTGSNNNNSYFIATTSTCFNNSYRSFEVEKMFGVENQWQREN
ncbi:hypothetical protein K2173_015854 [Erythroxylum novogranatense]|uniref:Uncharacterized protein n=1 Tax=Erythroxylum novogranatense TaxID=1862640 RepID=A0AAV8SER6_9ROSI|nr:hypothetical protein K2173_015854 [Erythroxylum novogranatense]